MTEPNVFNLNKIVNQGSRPFHLSVTNRHDGTDRSRKIVLEMGVVARGRRLGKIRHLAEGKRVIFEANRANARFLWQTPTRAPLRPLEPGADPRLALPIPSPRSTTPSYAHLSPGHYQDRPSPTPQPRDSIKANQQLAESGKRGKTRENSPNLRQTLAF